MKHSFRPYLIGLMTLSLSLSVARAWDYEGHRVVNQVALATLPASFPAFVRTPANAERIAFLAGEPDRWRNQGSGRNPTDDVALSHFAGPDHYFDLEELDTYGIAINDLPVFRFDFVAQLGIKRVANPTKFHAPDPLKDQDHTLQLPGFAPWAITELCGKLRSGFSYLKAYQDYGGTPDEIANAQQNIIYVMGVMGHYVGDCAQPLHVTQHHHGWIGDNPKGYTTNGSFHSWIDGGFLRKTGGIEARGLIEKIRPAKIVNDPTKNDDLFRKVMIYLVETHKLVEPLYVLEKEQKLTPENEHFKVGREFLEAQITRGGQMLGDLWFSAWQQAAEDKYLVRQLTERKVAAEAKK
jgi:hypothetical protein